MPKAKSKKDKKKSVINDDTVCTPKNEKEYFAEFHGDEACMGCKFYKKHLKKYGVPSNGKKSKSKKGEEKMATKIKKGKKDKKDKVEKTSEVKATKKTSSNGWEPREGTAVYKAFQLLQKNKKASHEDLAKLFIKKAGVAKNMGMRYVNYFIEKGVLK